MRVCYRRGHLLQGNTNGKGQGRGSQSEEKESRSCDGETGGSKSGQGKSGCFGKDGKTHSQSETRSQSEACGKKSNGKKVSCKSQEIRITESLPGKVPLFETIRALFGTGNLKKRSRPHDFSCVKSLSFLELFRLRSFECIRHLTVKKLMNSLYFNISGRPYDEGNGY